MTETRADRILKLPAFQEFTPEEAEMLTKEELFTGLQTYNDFPNPLFVKQTIESERRSITLDETINEQFRDFRDGDEVKVQVSCSFRVPNGTRFGCKVYCPDVFSYEGDIQFLKLVPHYFVYKDWKVNRGALGPACLLQKNELHCLVNQPSEKIAYEDIDVFLNQASTK